MAILYVTSSQKSAGKTMICAGLGRRLLNDRKKVGFIKLGADGADGDALFMKEALSLQEPVEAISVMGSREDLAGKVKQACDQVARGKDVVIIEGIPLEESAEVVKAVNAKALIVVDYSAQPEIQPDNYRLSNLLGIVLNKVPQKKVEKLSGDMSAILKDAGMNLLGVVPEDRILMAQTVAELTEKIKGKLLNASGKANELVENIMFGAMTVDHGPYYFSRKNNKAAVLKGERPDMQMAALQTSTRCIVIDKETTPIPEVLNQAEKKGVPIISAPGNVQSLAEAIEGSFAQAKFNQVKKLTRLAEIMEKNFNFAVLYQGLGLALA